MTKQEWLQFITDNRKDFKDMIKKITEGEKEIREKERQELLASKRK